MFFLVVKIAVILVTLLTDSGQSGVLAAWCITVVLGRGGDGTFLVRQGQMSQSYITEEWMDSRDEDT